MLAFMFEVNLAIHKVKHAHNVLSHILSCMYDQYMHGPLERFKITSTIPIVFTFDLDNIPTYSILATVHILILVIFFYKEVLMHINKKYRENCT